MHRVKHIHEFTLHRPCGCAAVRRIIEVRGGSVCRSSVSTLGYEAHRMHYVQCGVWDVLSRLSLVSDESE